MSEPSVMARYSLPFNTVPEIRRVTAPFHRELPGGRHAVDFYMPPGTPIRAARDGVVVYRESRFSRSADVSDKQNATKGNVVVVEHADGESTLYAHVQWRSVRVPVGGRVRRGQIIALSGQTGYAAYPHLHFGVYTEPAVGSGETTRIPDFREAPPPTVSWKRYCPGLEWSPV